MLLRIRHTTTYRYEKPPRYLIQALRMTPNPFAGQTIRAWAVRVQSGDNYAQKSLPHFTDGFGNQVHTLSAVKPAAEIMLTVEGLINTSETHGIIQGASETLAPLFYCAQTPLTYADAALRSLAQSMPSSGSDVDRIHHLMSEVRARVDYVPNSTHPGIDAATALAQGAGVCQDHAHVLIAVARAVGFPARYISGYLWIDDETQEAASHAWAEVFIADLGWVGFDPANQICPTEAYVRVAVGRDYADAAPVRGIHHGGGEESLEVAVDVHRISAIAPETSKQMGLS